MTGGNGNKGGDLDRFVEGEDVNAFGLHLIGTPDTRVLVESVAKYVQEVLDKGRTANKNPTPRQTISHEIIPEYKKFASGEMILSLQESVRGKHVYAFIDP